MSNQSQQLLEQDAKNAAQAIYTYAAQMMSKGANRKKIVEALKTQGIDDASANIVVDRLEQIRRQAARDHSGRDMMIGGLICIVGIIVTVGSYSMAASSSRGGNYVVAYGAVIFGAFQFLRGLINSMR